MEMKWNPIVNGDLSGIPIDEELLFTVFYEQEEAYRNQGLEHIRSLREE